MISRRRLLALAAALPLAACGPRESPPRPRRLGHLAFASAGDTGFIDPILQELGAQGFKRGENLVIVTRYADGDFARLPALARELAAEKPDAVVTFGTPATQAMREASAAIPIVAHVADPIGAGFARSLAAPGFNITGLSTGQREMYVRLLAMLRLLVPGLGSVFMLVRPDYGPIVATRYLVEESTRDAGLELRFMHARTLDEATKALRSDRRAGVRAGIVVPDEEMGFGKQLADAAIANRVALAAVTAGPATPDDWVAAGGALSHGTNHRHKALRMATCLARVLKGDNPATIPIEVPDESRTSLNRATVATLGLKLPPELMLLADEVVG